MGLWSRIQINGALQRLSKRIAATPHLWQFANDNRPHFDHWVEEHASDGDLSRASAELASFLQEIPAQYAEREWGRQLIAIVQGSMECVDREMQRRRQAKSNGGAKHSSAGRSGRSKRKPAAVRERGLALEKERQKLIQLVDRALSRQRKKFAGRVHNETDERSVRLVGLLDATFELYEANVPGIGIALGDAGNRRNLADNLTVEYTPLLMLDPDELPKAFVEYLLWKFGDDERSNADIEYLKQVFQRGISLLPPETQEAAISGKHNFEWGKLV